MNPNGAVTRFTYDVLDRLVVVSDALGGLMNFAYDPVANLLAVTDARGNTTTHTYDEMNRLATRTDPLGRSESYTYDLNGSLRTLTDRKGQSTTHTYDAQNRRTRTEYADGSSIAYAYDPAGNLLTATDSLTGTITRSYDALNRLAEEITPQGAITYAYDQASRRQVMQASGLQPVSYGYDAASRLTQITQGSQNATLAYDPADRRTSLVLPNGITVEYQYDEASRLIAQTYSGPGGVLGDLTYTYDATGSRIATGGSWARTGIPNPVSPTSYDAANQQLAFGAVTQTFDANGNLLTQADTSGTTTYTWDARNRLMGINGPTVSATFAYDAVGRRMSKTTNGVYSTFHYDGMDTVKESGGNGEASYLRTLGIDEALSRTDSSGAVAYLTDILGSTIALADAIPAIAATYTYEPFGRTEASGTPTANPFQFTGRENDGAELYYYRARYHNPGGNRFISEDPNGLAGGDTNLYAFVANSPLNLIDPSGLDFRPGPKGYGRPWNPSGIPHSHPILPGGDGGALVNPNDPGRLPGTTHDKNPLEGKLCIKCNWIVMQSCMATAPTPTTVWSCYLCDQARLNGTPAIAVPSCLQCAGIAAVKYGECFTRACGVGRTDGCGRCK